MAVVLGITFSNNAWDVEMDGEDDQWSHSKKVDQEKNFTKRMQ
jgi:hypothetical protein